MCMWRKPQYLEKTLFNYYFVHHKCYMDWPGEQIWTYILRDWCLCAKAMVQSIELCYTYIGREFTFLNPPGKQHLGHACISDISAVLLPCKVFLELRLPSYQTTCYHLQEDGTLSENVRSQRMQEVPLRGAHRPQRTLLVKVCVMLVVYVAGVLKFCVSSFLSQFKKNIQT
jgi:hypothetical protein